MTDTTEPHVHVVRQDGTHHVLTVTLGDAQWERRYRSFTSALVAAEKWVALQRTPGIADKTLSDFVLEWHQDYLTRECSSVTWSDYERCYRLLVEPEIGDVLIGEITPERVGILLNDLYARGGFVTVNRGRRMLSAALGVAESWGYIPRNPVGALRA